ncbi:styrene monooxygenase/indole monooxygenase family protein [Pigmentiphaga sp. D-2]|uniref:styrene monooxygenase/indole monooxygenase family protein n=1 Tax=Pigmentiphaga sp. D-2 TaxID=1002116 RepID=UPI0010431865|nr:styrene monooxygenase/indole monooxygenase family protein [Pigmentiphaga sp. D-2]
MKKIAIVGGGQCGLHLGFGLLDRGHRVTLYSDRTSEQLLNSRIQSTAFLFNQTLEWERRLGLNFWEEDAPAGEGMLVDFRDPQGKPMLTVAGRLLDKRGNAIDQRTKFARWMQEFGKRGGELVIRTVTVDDLEEVAAGHDLVFVASGKGPVNALFERDAARSRHEAPPRHLAAMLLRGSRLVGDRPWPKADFRPLRFNFVAGVGEFFSLPFYTHTAGECRSFLFEARPGGPMDRFGDAADGAALLEIARQVVQEFAPDDASYFDDARLTDPNAWLKGAFTPTVRKPVGRLPSGRTVMGVGDAVCLNDPIAGQGANNASRMAEHLMRCMDASGEWDAAWMARSFDSFWDTSASYTTAFTNLLLEPPGEAVMTVLGAASQHRAVADDFMRCFEEPRGYWPWIEDVEAARQFVVQRVQHAA